MAGKETGPLCLEQKHLSTDFTDDKWQDRLRQQSLFEAYKCRRHVRIFIYTYALNNTSSFHYKDQAFNST